jgi:hypothetical protein
VSPADGNLHLASNIEIGGIILTNEVPDDIDQTPRYVGAEFEIGADELLATDINVGFIDDEIKIFPNPGSGIFYITGFNKGKLGGYIEVFNAIGQRIDVRLKLLDSGCEIDLIDQPSGIYLFKFRDENEYYLKNLIICRI